MNFKMKINSTLIAFLINAGLAAISIIYDYRISMIVNSFFAGCNLVWLINEISDYEEDTEPNGNRATETLTKKD